VLMLMLMRMERVERPAGQIVAEERSQRIGANRGAQRDHARGTVPGSDVRLLQAMKRGVRR
jgi:hypothetical protein